MTITQETNDGHLLNLNDPGLAAVYTARRLADGLHALTEEEYAGVTPDDAFECLNHMRDYSALLPFPAVVDWLADWTHGEAATDGEVAMARMIFNLRARVEELEARVSF